MWHHITSYTYIKSFKPEQTFAISKSWVVISTNRSIYMKIRRELLEIGSPKPSRRRRHLRRFASGTWGSSRRENLMFSSTPSRKPYSLLLTTYQLINEPKFLCGNLFYLNYRWEVHNCLIHSKLYLNHFVINFPKSTFSNKASQICSSMS